MASFEGYSLALGSIESARSEVDLAALVETYSALLFRVAHSVLRSRPEAEDVVQDVFVRVLEHRRTLPDVRDLRVWLIRIAWNLAIDRRRRIRPEQFDVSFAEGLVGSSMPADEALDEAQRVYDADLSLFNNKAIPRNQLDADKAKLDQARVAYNQALEQAKLGAVSGFNGNSVQYAVAAARKAQILNAQNQQQVGFTRIVAPFEGTIQTVAAQTNDALRSLQSGDPVTAGQALFTMSGGAGFIVKAQVDEQDVINVKPGQRANVSGQDFPGKTIVGRVARIAPVATKSTDATSTAKQVLTTIALGSSPSFLKDGMTADVDILTSYVPKAVVVPNDAVMKEGSNSYVYVVERGVARKRPIRVGKVADTQTQVTSGLAPGDDVVVAKVPGLADGKRVKPLSSPKPSPSRK